MTHVITLDSLGKDHIQQFSNRYLHAIAHLDLPSHPTFASKKWPKICQFQGGDDACGQIYPT